jgi:hypothetical protein
MKQIFILSVLLCALNTLIFGQSQTQVEIKKLDSLEMNAILKGDTTTLLNLWDKNYVVNNPYGVIVTVPEILGFIRKGEIDYSSVVRITERVTLNDNIAISMGKEILKPQNLTPNAGKDLIYRYTHIWMKKKNKWLLVARQATNFSL